MPGPEFAHAHKCRVPSCGVLWFHDPQLLGPEEHAQAHHCPACGTEQRWVNMRYTYSMTVHIEAGCVSPETRLR